AYVGSSCDFDDRRKWRKSVKLPLVPLDDVACLAAVVASGRIGLEAGRVIRAHLERKPRDIEPLLRGCPTRKNTHKRGPDLSGILWGPRGGCCEKNRAGGACFDVFGVAMDGFSE